MSPKKQNKGSKNKDLNSFIIGLIKKTALISFIVGTAIFGLYFLSSNFLLLFWGYAFIIFAGVFNIIILISTLIIAKNDYKNRSTLLKTSGLLLINIPFVLIYSWISLLLLDYMRITFTNETNHKLTEINIIGCKPQYIAELEPNESTTIWVKIQGECSISIDYMEKGHKKNENVVGYVSSKMGEKINHEIGGEN